MSETPLERVHRLVMEQVCGGIRDELVKECEAQDLTGVGFAIILFDFGDGGSCAYASNGNRQDMIKLLREMVGKLERGA
jgi:hypothetical protein